MFISFKILFTVVGILFAGMLAALTIHNYIHGETKKNPWNLILAIWFITYILWVVNK